MHLLLPPTSPLHQGGTARPTQEGGQEGSAQTALLFGRAGAATALPSTGCAGEGHTPELPPVPVLSTWVWGGRHRETAPPPPVPVMRTGCTRAPHPSDYEEAPLQADSTGSAQPPAPAAWGESTGTGAKEQAAGSPASSQPEQGSQWGSECSGWPGCAALRPAPVALVPRQGWKAAVW